jgi:sugar lactone lactonase YvrE
MRARPFFARGVGLLLIGAGVLSFGAAVALAATFHAASMFFGSAAVTEDPVNSFDISYVDPAVHQYYLADRSNKDVDVFDTQSNLWVNRVTGFTGAVVENGAVNNDVSGPNGVVVTRSGRELYVGDGASKLQVVNLQALSIVDTINTGGAGRADELDFSPGTRQVLVANDAESDGTVPCPFLSFVSTTSRKVVAQVVYDGGLAHPTAAHPCGLGNVPTTHAAAATDGLEQPLWDPRVGAFFQAVPEVGGVPGGQIDELNPLTHTVVNSFPVGSPTNPCHPQGLTLGADGRIWTGCNPGTKTPGIPRVISINPINGNQREVNILPAGSGGPDEIWFNSGDRRLYTADSTAGKLSVVDTTTNSLVENVTTATGSHSVAADSSLNHIFVPENAAGCVRDGTPVGCVAVFESGAPGRAADDNDKRDNRDNRDDRGDRADRGDRGQAEEVTASIASE